MLTNHVTWKGECWGIRWGFLCCLLQPWRIHQHLPSTHKKESLSLQSQVGSWFHIVESAWNLDLERADLNVVSRLYWLYGLDKSLNVFGSFVCFLICAMSGIITKLTSEQCNGEQMRHIIEENAFNQPNLVGFFVCLFCFLLGGLRKEVPCCKVFKN